MSKRKKHRTGRRIGVGDYIYNKQKTLQRILEIKKDNSEIDWNKLTDEQMQQLVQLAMDKNRTPEDIEEFCKCLNPSN